MRLASQMWRDIPVAAEELDHDPGRPRGSGCAGLEKLRSFREPTSPSSMPREAALGAEQYDRDNGRAFAALSPAFRKPVIALDSRLLHRRRLRDLVDGGHPLCVRRRGVRDSRGPSRSRVRSFGGLEALVRYRRLPVREGSSSSRGGRFDAHEAHHMGLVNRVFPKAELEAGVRKLAETHREQRAAHVAQRQADLRSARAGASRSVIRMPSPRSIRQIVTRAKTTAEVCRAFLEKRRPDFNGT